MSPADQSQEEIIDQLINRAVVNILPDSHSLRQRLIQGPRLTVYLGIDPTAPRIHLGHAVPLRKLNAIAQLGHQVILLIGDFTALIGDTSDKESERPALTEEQIQQNWQTYRQQAEKILDFDKVEIKFNSQWLSQVDLKQTIRLCQQFSAGDFYSREIIRRRLQAGKKVGLHEVLYSVMQGYDMYHMDADLQIGGADQTFNMQAGRHLQKVWRDKDTFLLVTDYLPGTDGRKMSKSWGNAIWLSDEPDQVYGKVMSLADDLIITYFELATNLPQQQIDQLAQQLDTGANPRDIKAQLAWQITAELFDRATADQAQTRFQQLFSQHQLPSDLPEITLPAQQTSLLELLVQNQLVPSRSQAKRLIQQKGVKYNQQVVTDWQQQVKPQTGDILQVGKRRWYRIKTS